MMDSRTIPELLVNRAKKSPDQVAVIVDGAGTEENRMTYREWDRKTNIMAREIYLSGIAPGDRVAILFSNRESIAFLIAYFAIHKAGGVVVPVNTRLTASEINYILSNSGAVGMIAESLLLPILEEARAELPAEPWLIQKGLRPRDGEHRWQDWDELLEQGDPSPFLIQREPGDLADIIYTSGTTGFPKGVACNHSNIVSLGMNSKLDAVYGGKSYLHAIPYFTFAGLHMMLLFPVKAGMTSIVQAKFNAKGFLALIEEHRVVMTYAVPSMLLLMLDEEDIGKRDYSSLGSLMYGTAPMPADGIRKLATFFKQARLTNIYGLTEGGGARCSLSPSEAIERPGSIGKPAKGVGLKIVTETGAQAKPNELGEIRMRSDSRRSYFNNEEATEKTWTADGWLKTGDMGYVDADGYLYLAGRNKDMIIRGGFNVYPVEIEGVLHEHPSVLEAAVVGVPHKILGEDVKAFIVLRRGSEATEDTIKTFCAGRLADYKSPKQIEFILELPRNALGKVLKRMLRNNASEDKSGTGLSPVL